MAGENQSGSSVAGIYWDKRQKQRSTIPVSRKLLFPKKLTTKKQFETRPSPWASQYGEASYRFSMATEPELKGVDR